VWRCSYLKHIRKREGVFRHGARPRQASTSAVAASGDLVAFGVERDVANFEENDGGLWRRKF